MLKRKINLLPILIMFALLFVFSVKADASSAVKRLSGLNRYATSASVALEGWQQSDYAILTYGENFPDALSSAPLAKKYNAPILLTQNDSLPAETINALQQLKVKYVFIIGGTGVISNEVENQVNSIGINTTRLFGQDRYETDIKVAEQLDNVSEIAIVTGEDFPDALSISPIAVKRNMPIILIQHNIIPDVVKAYINSHNITKTYVIGAGSSIGDTALNGLTNVEKISGQDKYEINLAVIDRFKSDLDFNTIYLASGENFPDGLTGSILAGKNSNPMLLTCNDTSLEKDYLNKNNISLNNIDVLGGTGVITDDAVNNLYSTLSVTDVSKNANAIVKVEAKDSNNAVLTTGSGCIISSDGKLMTNYHVIDGAYFADVVLQDGSKYEVDGLLGYNKAKDIAVLKLKNASNLPIVQLGDSDTLQLGDQIVTIGSPFGIQNTVSTGIVSGLNRTNSREGKDIQISASIDKGSAGGGLFNMYGKVIGITYLGTTSTGNFNFAIPINDVKMLMDISTITQLSQLASPTVPTNTNSFFPLLSDVPIPKNASYYRVSAADDGKHISYYYKIALVSHDFVSTYFKLLESNGWKLFTSSTDSSGKLLTVYEKGDNEISIGFSGYDVYIMGNIH